MRRRALADNTAFLSDLRHLALACIAAVVIAGATAPRHSLVLVAFVVAASGPVRKHDFVPELLAAALAFALWSSIAWSQTPDFSSRVAADQITVAGLFIAFRLGIGSRRGLAFVSAGYVVGSGMLIRRVLAENPNAVLSLERSLDSTRYTIEGVNQNYIAFSLAAAIAALIVLTQVWRRALPLWVFLGLVCWAGILLNGTRAGILAETTTPVWWFFVPDRLRRKGLRIIVAVVVVIAAGTFSGFVDDQLREVFTASSERDIGGLNGRLSFWPIAREVFYSHPLFGIGAGAITLHTPNQIFAHNVLLDVGTSAGVIGLTIFVAAMWATLFRTTRGLADHDPGQRLMLIGVFICASAAPLLSGYWYQTAPFWLLLAIFSRMPMLSFLKERPKSRGAGSKSRHDQGLRPAMGGGWAARQYPAGPSWPGG